MAEEARRVNLEELRRQFKGKPFYLLVEKHVKHGKTSGKILLSTQGTLEILPMAAQNIAPDFIDRWLPSVYDPEFWRRDCSDVFTDIIEDARNVLSCAGSPIDDKTLFNMFQIVLLSYAYSAVDQPNMRKFMRQQTKDRSNQAPWKKLFRRG